jgi:hypothetical protein
MKTSIIVGALTLFSLVLTGCDGPLPQSTITKNGTDSIGQRYSITFLNNVDKEKLPATSNMKLANFDVTMYLERACIDAWKESRCDAYVQYDPNGSLVGYLFIKQYNGSLSFETDTKTTPLTPESKDCTLGGAIENSDFDPTKDFKARSPFTYENGMGMIYLEKIANHLRVTDERWNYCYENRHLDDVYTLIGTFSRQLEPQRWTR